MNSLCLSISIIIALLSIDKCVVHSLSLDQRVAHYNGPLQQNNLAIPFLESKIKVQAEEYVEKFTESPYDLEETTTEKFSYNVTLDVLNDTTTRDWKTSPVRSTLKKWFEYYDNTDDLNQNVTDVSKCPNVISEFSSQLSEVEGIWVSCQDPLLPKDCSMSTTLSAACHPFITYSFGDHVSVFRTVKINLFLGGLAIVRLRTGSAKIDDSGRCFDYSLRRDPFSSCEYIKVENTTETGWIQVKSNFDGYDYTSFNSFSIQLIARFKNDVALVEKVEATDYLLCGDEDSLCSTTPPGTTHAFPTPKSTPLKTTTTTTPTTTVTTTTTTPTTTKSRATTTTVSSTESANVTLTTHAPIKETTLDAMSDAENERKWEIPSLSSRWLEYYTNSASLIDQAGDPNTCASILSPILDDLTEVEGIWSSCYDQALINHHTRSVFSSPPNINYSSNTDVITSLTVHFYLYGSAFIRLHVGNKCIDYSYNEDPLSTCEWGKLLHDGVYWQGIFWNANSLPEQVQEFRVDLITLSLEDVVLLDKIVVKYKEQCNGNDCFPSTTSTTDHTSETTEKVTDCPTTDSGSTESTKSTTTTERNTETTESSHITDGNTESSKPSTLCPTSIAPSSSTIPRSTTPGDKSSSNTLTLNMFALQVLIAILLF